MPALNEETGLGKMEHLTRGHTVELASKQVSQPLDHTCQVWLLSSVQMLWLPPLFHALTALELLSSFRACGVKGMPASAALGWVSSELGRKGRANS